MQFEIAIAYLEKKNAPSYYFMTTQTNYDVTTVSLRHNTELFSDSAGYRVSENWSIWKQFATLLIQHLVWNILFL